MGESIGPKIAVEGEKEFKNALRDINANLKTLGTEMKAVTSAFDSNDKSQSALTAQNQVLNKQIDEQKNKLELLKAKLAETSSKYGENDAQTQKMQQAVNLATADLNKMERQLGDNNEALRDVQRGYNDAGQKLDEYGNVVDASNKKFEKFGDAMKGIAVAAAAAAAAAGAAAVALAKQVVSAYADYEQLVGGVDTLFGESSARVQEYANNAYKTAGLSANEYMETVTSFSASLIASLGGDTEKATKYADMAITDMSDNANKMGTDMGSIQNAYQGFAKGNYGMLDNLKLGYGGTKEEMERLLADAEKLSGQKYDISSLNDVYTAVHVVQTEMGITGTTALEASETISGSIGSMKSAWANFLTGLGNSDADMAALTQNLVSGFQDVVRNVTPIIENIASAMPDALAAILAAVGDLLPALLSTVTTLFEQVLDSLLSMLPGLIPVAVDALGVIAGALIDNIPLLITSALALVAALSDGLIDGLPELIPAAVDAVVTVVETLLDNIDMLVDAAIDIITALADGLIDALPTLIEKAPVIIVKLVNAFITNAPKMLEAAEELIAKLGEGLAENFKAIMSKVASWVDENIVQPIRDKFDDFKEAGGHLLEGLWNGISDKVKWLKDQVSGVVDKIKGWFTGKDGFDEHSPSKWAQSVGVFVSQGLGIGITDGITYARRASTKLTDAVKSGIDSLNKQLAKMQEQERKEQSEKEVAAYKKAIADKYEELGKAEETGKQKVLDEIAKLQADWNEKQVKAERDAAKEALQERINSLEEFKKEYDSAVADIEDSQQSMADKLSGYGDLMQTATTKNGKDFLKLGDLQSDIDKITEYGNALAELKERGISDSLMDEITNMDIDDATNYAELLLKKTPEQYDKYMELWEEKQQLAGDVAKQFYKDEFTQLQEEFVDKVPEELSGLKTEMEGIGKNSAQGLADGFWAKKDYISSTFKSVLAAALSEAKEAMEIHSPSRKWAEVGSFMAQGLGVGFSEQMRAVSRQIDESIPTSFDGPAAVASNAASGVVNGMSALIGASKGGAYNINLVVDGRTIAGVMWDPLKDISRQKGVAPA